MSDPSQSPAPKRRRTIGIMSESAYFLSESLIFQGARRAAERYDFNLALIMPLDDSREATHYGSGIDESEDSFRERCRRLKAYLDTFELDGLIYLGWSPQFQGERGRYLLDTLKPIRLMSISGSFPDIPFVFMPGGRYIEELTRHLIREHGCRRVAYVHTWSYDGRFDSYKAAMSEHGLYDDRLVVQVDELADRRDADSRMRRAAALLFDERDMPVDAIIVLNACEIPFMLEELRRRRQRVPDAVRLVCCENDPGVQYAKPSITAIEYPFEALSYAACERLLETFDGKDIPLAAELPTRIYYRDSCGCTVGDVRPIRHALPDGLAGTSDLPPSPADIAAALHAHPVADAAEAELLSARWLGSLASGDGAFLEAFGEWLNRQRRFQPYECGRLLEGMREAFLPYAAADAGRYARSEAIWFAARQLVRNYENSRSVDDYVRKSDVLNKMNSINKNLLATRTTAEVPKVLLEALESIGIPSFYLFLTDMAAAYSRPQDAKLFFAADDRVDRTGTYPPQHTFEETFRLYRAYKAERDARFSLIVMPLQVSEEQIGVAWADPGEHETTTVTGLFDETAKALKAVRLHEELHELVGRLKGEIVLRSEKEAQLAYFADVDALTGLFNRRFFYDALQRLQRTRHAFTLFYLDIDGFKQVNDTLGHDAGDLLLRHIAGRLRELLSDDAIELEHPSLGDSDEPMRSVFRMGGDEFTVLLRTSSRDEAGRLADALCRAIRLPYDLNGSEARISSSIGIARYPADAADQDRLVKCADIALYRAKAGKDKYRFYGESGAS